MRQEWAGAKRIVVKIGSALLVDAATGTLHAEWLETLGDDIAALRKQGRRSSWCPRAPSRSAAMR